MHRNKGAVYGVPDTGYRILDKGIPDAGHLMPEIDTSYWIGDDSATNNEQ